ncbi:MAG TPA: four helix bundle protein [Methylomirabilota bacterium]|nr:four helix bundle protein [Methylomirabilota bacterium]
MFPHEATPVYQQALEFAKWCEPVLERTPKQSAMHGQLDHTRTTILLKIAASAGRASRDEKSSEAAQTAAIECAACLDLLFNKRVVSRDELQRGKESLQKLIALLGVNTIAPEPHAKAA